MNMVLQSPEAMLNAISDLVAESQRALKVGEMVDLSDIDQFVYALCEAILDLSQEERVQYSDRLQRLLQDITLLCEQLEEGRAQLAGEIQQVSSHAKASTAYRIVDTLDSVVKKDKP